MINLSKILTYIKFINVAYPPLFQKILDNQDTSLNVFIPFPKTFNQIKQQAQNSTVPIFRKYDLTSCFLLEFWFPIFVILLALIITLFTEALYYFTKKKPKIALVAQVLRNKFKWNFFITRFVAYYDGIVLLTSLQLRVVTFNALIPIISILVLMVINFMAFAIPIRVLRVLAYIRKAHEQIPIEQRRARVLDKMDVKWRGYKVIYQDFKRSTFLQHGFLVIFIVRICLFYLSIAYLYEYPLAQIIISLLINVLMMAYLVLKPPFNIKWMLIVQIIEEMMIFVVNICILILQMGRLRTQEVKVQIMS